MLPDFKMPAFAHTALCSVRFRSTEKGAEPQLFKSDLRCELRWQGSDDRAMDVRVYFVGRDHAKAGEEVPALLAFADYQEHGAKLRTETVFELFAGAKVLAEGTIHAVASR